MEHKEVVLFWGKKGPWFIYPPVASRRVRALAVPFAVWQSRSAEKESGSDLTIDFEVQPRRKQRKKRSVKLTPSPSIG